ncbi:P-loop containing nucleoside triphosphate hydrolase protein [Pseudoneurospora amorphoporcata]|uniref:GTP:AMP phosphotransferase, mitochondrial n=1 Tax=Pseudoneurospora amorphoporcata TaxID=241081 RepID=A0AAN6P236_9PEZI|nr:P-loop containing nucleoside triphosphate hydrolase protein [Pseudoneurospora amorphoporcata]
MALRRAARVILVGAPGVGKGTQSERLLQRFPQLSSISSGDLLRYNVKQRTPLGIKVESVMKSGGLVSDDIILRLISNELSQRGWLNSTHPAGNVLTLASSALSAEGAQPFHDDAEVAAFLSSPAQARGFIQSQLSDDPAHSFLLDGFPRTAIQARRLDEIIPINLVVSLKTPVDVILERISGRWVHEPSGRVYNTTFNAPKVPGVDDITGEPLVRRADDDEKVYLARYKKFQETAEPLLEHYARQGVLWEVEGMSSDEITPKLIREFERRFVE